MAGRQSKKSETLQVRLPYGMKRDFMDRVKLENRSASDLIRDFIEGYLAGPVEILSSPTAVMIRRRFIYPTLMAAGLVGAVIVFMPNPGAAGTLRSEFDAMDVNRDGFIMASEFVTPSPAAMMNPTRRPYATPRAGPDGIKMQDADGKPLRVRTIRPDETGAALVAQPGEVLLTPAQMKQHLLNYFDADDDHKLSFQEFRDARLRGARSNFDRLDADLDDKVSQDEYITGRIPTLNPGFLASLTPERRQQAKANQPRIHDMVLKEFEAFDLDNDGVVTRTEMIPS